MIAMQLSKFVCFCNKHSPMIKLKLAGHEVQYGTFIFGWLYLWPIIPMDPMGFVLCHLRLFPKFLYE